MRWTHRTRRAAAAITAAAVLALASAGCSGDGGGGEARGTGEAAPERTAGTPGSTSDGWAGVAGGGAVVTTLQGPEGIVLDLHSVVRDSGGFVTAEGVLRNTSDEKFFRASLWTGPELELKKGAGGGSLGGATLVDKAEKKRYYVLRDTEGRPLASMGLGTIEPHSEQNVFMQFPAPPKSTTEVDLQIPTFQNATVRITEG